MVGVSGAGLRAANRAVVVGVYGVAVMMLVETSFSGIVVKGTWTDSAWKLYQRGEALMS